MSDNAFNIKPTILTQRDIEPIFKKDSGIYGFLSLNGTVLDFTSDNIPLFTAGNSKSKEAWLGKTMYDLYAEKDLVSLYNQNYQIAYQQNEFFGFEKTGGKLLLVRKVPVYDNNSEILRGCFSHALIVGENHLSNFIDHLQKHQEALTSHVVSSYEIINQDMKFDLTSRELECLFYTLRGMTAKSVARKLNISPKTVEFHLENLKDKFNCRTKSELIAKAIDLGYLDKIPVSVIDRNNF